MTQTTDLAALRERVMAATGPDRDLDEDIHAATNPKLRPGFRLGVSPKYTGSIDAALALVARVLPNAKVTMQFGPNPWATIYNPSFMATEKAADLPLSIIAALLAAMEHST